MPALVMELVPGEDLAHHITRAPVRVEEALRIAAQIADALDAAHERGIVHRDLKPANIKLTPDGLVKVLDFGLAKALEPASTGAMEAAETFTSPAMTESGVILGTAPYMAPEQARGQAVDRRADIWAFGCVLYEMLSGQRAFRGRTVSDVSAAILTAEPDWSALPAGIHRTSAASSRASCRRTPSTERGTSRTSVSSSRTPSSSRAPWSRHHETRGASGARSPSLRSRPPAGSAPGR